MVSFGERFRDAFNVFRNPREQVQDPYRDYGISNTIRPDRQYLTIGNERSIISSIYNRIAIDTAALTFKHARVDQNGRYISTIPSLLENCLSLEANIDQTSRSFIQDIVYSMCDEGSVAVVPVDTTSDIHKPGSFDIRTMRVGKIVQWYPAHVKVRLYNDRKGTQEEIVVSKTRTAIIENPLYAVMNAPNSTLKRLINKLVLLDSIDQQNSAGKLDLLIQLPYVIKSEARREQAEVRRKDIEMQLSGSKYGIAYIDGTERVTQLNRPAENNLMNQITYLTGMLYSQLGLTEDVFNGTADEKTMLNYHNRTIEPIASAITLSMKRAFLTKTARTQGQSIEFFRDPFKLVPVNQIADIADKLTRNEILSSNEVRGIIGYRPSEDPAADKLRNKNLNPTMTEGDYYLDELDNEKFNL